jgi:hypothetical protein
MGGAAHHARARIGARRERDNSGADTRPIPPYGQSAPHRDRARRDRVQPHAPASAGQAGIDVRGEETLACRRSYGEYEYWFSSIKVIAIALFLGMGVLRLTLAAAAKVVLDNVSATLSGIRAGC